MAGPAEDLSGPSGVQQRPAVLGGQFVRIAETMDEATAENLPERCAAASLPRPQSAQHRLGGPSGDLFGTLETYVAQYRAADFGRTGLQQFLHVVHGDRGQRGLFQSHEPKVAALLGE
ncbi:MAG: hypothetical protein BUE48_012445 [Thermomonospora sp. CIF 1]|nr:MAG: hypothetical protein BUE48_012445 [Thermomonospora sp. CIF 1]